MVNYNKCPFPWFGGKQHAAPRIWEALGDCAHFVEPFMGSLAVLLRRPHKVNRPYYSETVNDIDGLLVNAWRAIQLRPDETAEHASWPVAEADLHARHLWLMRWKADRELEHLMGDPGWCDTQAAGYWLWGQSSWIGSGWCFGDGPWIVDAEGRMVKRDKTPREPGVSRKIPHISTNGKGVNHAGTREPGVSRKRPHITTNGQGVNHPGTREPGVWRQIPQLGDNGKGVNHAGTREPGVWRQRPSVSNNGEGVNHPGTREPGVSRKRLREDAVGADPDWHPMTMPELKNWFRFLSARLRHVRILNGDWTRAVTAGASKTINVRMGDSPSGIFLDPPYSDASSRNNTLYAHESTTVAHDVRDWCIQHGKDPQLRIVLAGFEGEHEALSAHGWTSVQWFKSGYLRGGMGGKLGQQARERLWLSPHCEIEQDLFSTLLRDNA